MKLSGKMSSQAAPGLGRKDCLVMSATSSGGESGGTVCLPLLAQVIATRPFSQRWAHRHHMLMEGGTLGPACTGQRRRRALSRVQSWLCE